MTNEAKNNAESAQAQKALAIARAKAKAKRSARRGHGLVWKSGIVTASLAASLLGWGLLSRADAANDTALQTQQPRVVVVQVPAASNRSNLNDFFSRNNVAPNGGIEGNNRSGSTFNLQPLPRRPIFRRPLTRTRRS